MTPLDIEHATIRTWPARVTEERDGWFYLADGGVTGRVNAVFPLDWRGASLHAAIDDVEAWYAAHHLPPRFKMTDGAIAPDNLREALLERGYTEAYPTLVMTMPACAAETRADVDLSDAMPPAFDAALQAMSRDAAEYDERVIIARRAPQPRCFAIARRDNEVASIGMTVVSEALAGIFLMRTMPHARRQGLARLVLDALANRAKALGARTLFLQVDADNAPAIALYESAGFATLTRYYFLKKAA
ncbi:MAG: GNAT family N-acetyltransferase [Terricaulis sp.]